MQLTAYLPVAVFIVVALLLGLLLLVIAKRLGPRRDSVEKNIAYECGQDPAGAPGIRLSARFYRVAILFLVFDLEAAFFYPWAVLYRELSCRGKIDAAGICHGSVSMFGFAAMAVFMVILILALVYVWRKKALQWD